MNDTLISLQQRQITTTGKAYNNKNRLQQHGQITTTGKGYNNKNRLQQQGQITTTVCLGFYAVSTVFQLFNGKQFTNPCFLDYF